MKMVGTSREMINHIQKNKDKVVYDIEKGVVTTEKGTHGFICSSTGYIRFKLSGRVVQAHTFFGVLIFGSDLEGMTINHKNGNKLDNRKENLEIMTLEDNVRHEWQTGLCIAKKPVNQKRVIQKDFQGRVIREFESISEAGRFHNVNPQRIRYVCIGRTVEVNGSSFCFA
ncbi:hypothetical protein CKY18_15320 [Enterococcus gallinarum]|nr:hypothetical protein CKY18_15320 [Enterococcus gallinarum]